MAYNFSSDEEDRPAVKKKKASARQRWTIDELDILAKAFTGLKKPPSAQAIRELQINCPLLQMREIAGIKSRAWHLISTGH
jgi:hypothetical protein